MRFEFGDVVLVRFPFTNQTTQKQRPAVVISSQPYHQSHPDLIVMAITSRTSMPGHQEVVLTEWKSAGLLKPSVVKPVIATLEKHLILKQLGACSPPTRLL